MKQPLFLLGLLLVCPVGAQQSASFNVTDHTFDQGSVRLLSSASFRTTLVAVGESIGAMGSSSPGFETDAGFGVCYPPPGEARELLFIDRDTLEWQATPYGGHYNLYRGPMSELSELAYGACSEADIAGTTTNDPQSTLPGDGMFYLLTAENLLGEEGPKGSDSDGDQRPNAAPCP